MKIAFVYPMFESLGIEYLSAALKKHGHQIRLFIDPVLFYNFLISINMLNRIFSFKRILLKEISNYRPDAVCFSVVSDYFPWASDVAKSLKAIIDVPIIFGGIHPTSVPERVIEKEFIDYVVVGEGDEALPELINALQKKVSIDNIGNVWFKRNGTIVGNPVRPSVANLDSLPFPDKELYYNTHYKGFFKEVYNIMCSRGCPYNCSYCHNSTLKKLYKGSKFLRWRNVDSIIEELKAAYSKYKFERVHFWDDLLTFDKEWLGELCLKYKKEIGLRFTCFVSPSMIDAEKISLLEKAGCKNIVMGVETLNENLRKKVLFRHDSNREISEAIKLIGKSKIYLFVNIILGLPEQTESEIIEMARFFSQNKVNSMNVFWLRYYPKTPITKYLSKEEIEKIEEGQVYLPFMRREQSLDKNITKATHLIFMSLFIPQSILNFLIKFKIYRAFPTVNSFLLSLIATSFLKRYFSKKKSTCTLYTHVDYIKYYLYFLYQLFKLNKKWLGRKR